MVLWALVMPLARLWVVAANGERSANLQRQHQAIPKLLSTAVTAQRRGLQPTCCARLCRCSKILLYAGQVASYYCPPEDGGPPAEAAEADLCAISVATSDSGNVVQVLQQFVHVTAVSTIVGIGTPVEPGVSDLAAASRRSL